jgi:hypothetical protein
MLNSVTELRLRRSRRDSAIGPKWSFYHCQFWNNMQSLEHSLGCLCCWAKWTALDISAHLSHPTNRRSSGAGGDCWYECRTACPAANARSHGYHVLIAARLTLSESGVKSDAKPVIEYVVATIPTTRAICDWHISSPIRYFDARSLCCWVADEGPWQSWASRRMLTDSINMDSAYS